MENQAFKDKREVSRFTLSLPLTYVEKGAAGPIKTFTHDISVNGLGMLSEKTILPGADLDLQLDMVDNGEKIFIKGKVKWAYLIDSLRFKYRIGIKLEDVRLKPIPLVLRIIDHLRKISHFQAFL